MDNPRQSDESGESSVVGTLILVAILVLLAASVGAFVYLVLGGSATENIDAVVDVNSERIELVETGTVDKVRVVAENGDTLGVLVEPGDEAYVGDQEDVSVIGIRDGTERVLWSGNVEHAGSPEDDETTYHTLTIYAEDADSGERLAGTAQARGKETTIDREYGGELELPEGRHSVSVDADRYYESTESIEVDGDKAVTVELSKYLYSVTINVVDENYNPVSATVYLDSESRNADDGTAEYDAEEGEYEVTVYPDGYPSETRTITVDSDTEETIVVGADVTLTATAVDESGNRMEATVSVDGQSKVTDASSKAAFELADGTYEVYADADGYQQSMQEVTIQNGEQEDITFQMDPEPAQLTVDLADENGNTIEGTVSVDGTSQDTAGGRATFEVARGQTYEVVGDSSGYDAQSRNVEVNEDTNVLFELGKEEADLDVTVVDENGDPVDTTVNVDGSSKTTGADGNTVFTLYTSDEYEVHAEAIEYYEDAYYWTSFNSAESVVMELSPQMNAVAEPYHVEVVPGEEIQWSGADSTYKGGTEPVERYAWDFDDGNAATGETATHAYDSPGEYEVELTISDGHGNTDTAVVTAIVEGSNLDASASVDPSSGDTTTTFTFDGSQSSGDAQITSYHWDFGDGTTATGEVVDHSYSSSGTYDATLTVEDEYGNTDTDTVTVSVDTATVLVGETGSFTLDAGSSDDWRTLNFQNSYKDPVVIAKPLSYNGGHEAHIRVDSVGSSSAQLKIEEWEYLDGSHTTETVHYVVMERGDWVLDDGTHIAADTIDTDDTYATASFPAAFDSTPVVFSQSQTYIGSDPIVTRNRYVDSTGFDVRVQEDEANGAHTTETVGYIAMDQGMGSTEGLNFEAHRLCNCFTDSWRTITFDDSYSSDRNSIIDMQTEDGGNTAGLRWSNFNSGSIDVFVEEEQSNDDETSHTDEAVGYWTFDADGSIYAQESSSDQVHESFENGFDWTVERDESGFDYSVSSNYAKHGDNSLYIYSNDYGTLSKQIPATTREGPYEFHIYQTNDPYDDFQIGWYDGSSQVFRLNVNRETTQNMHIYTNEGNTDTGVEMPHSQWVTVRFTDVDWSAGSFRYTVLDGNGEVVVEDTASFDPSQVSGVDTMRINSASQHSGTGEYYIDYFTGPRQSG